MTTEACAAAESSAATAATPKVVEGMVDEGMEAPTRARMLLALVEHVFDRVWREAVKDDLAKQIAESTAGFEA